jgi:hypothetical protein
VRITLTEKMRKGKQEKVCKGAILLSNWAFSFSLLPASECGDYLADIYEGARLANDHFVAQCHRAVNGGAESTEHLSVIEVEVEVEVRSLKCHAE